MNAEKKKAKSKAYRAAHREELNARRRVYRVAHKTETVAWSRIDHAAHRKERNAKSKAYYASHKSEMAARKKAYRASHKKEIATSIKASRLKRKYGLTPGAFDALLRGQGGKCAACGTVDWRPNGPAVDHDHATGAVRGILCGKCNLTEGLFKGDPSRVRALADYMERNRG